MTGGKGMLIAMGIMVLLSVAGSASAVPTFPVCLGGTDTFLGMTDRPIFGAVFIDAQGRDTRNSAQGVLPAPVPPDQTDLVTIGFPAPPLTMARATSNESNLDHRGTTCQIPSPGTLLLGAMGAFLVGVLRMRRML
jgi:hypothetical protein